MTAQLTVELRCLLDALHLGVLVRLVRLDQRAGAKDNGRNSAEGRREDAGVGEVWRTGRLGTASQSPEQVGRKS